jgi:ribosome-binding factor A
MTKRTVRLNSLLKEVISEVVHRDIHHIPHIDEFVTITRVEITSDLSFAKVFVSVLGDEKKKKQAVESLQNMAGLIAKLSSKKVTLRFFPALTFEIDAGLEKQLRIEELLSKLSDERREREQCETGCEDAKNEPK